MKSITKKALLPTNNLWKHQSFSISKYNKPIKRVNMSLFPLHEHPEFRNESKLRKAKTKLMKYDDVFKPFWMKLKKDDPFDYPLRSKEEVYYQMYLHPPFWNIHYMYNIQFEDLVVKASSNGNLYNKVKIYVKIKEMNLFPLQQQRLVFLLGRRYKQNGILKLVVGQTDNLETNVAIGRDTLKQLYLESLRAPLFISDWMSEEEKEEMYLNYGRTVDEGKKYIEKKYFDKTTEDYKKFLEFYSIVANPSVEYEVKLKQWAKHIKTFITEDDNQSNNKESEENKGEDSELLSRKDAYSKLVNEKKLSNKAYEIFFKDEGSNIL